MKSAIVAAILLAAGSAQATCFLERDESSGLNKICYYRCAGGGKAITVKSHQMCPMSISDTGVRPAYASKPEWLKKG